MEFFFLSFFLFSGFSHLRCGLTSDEVMDGRMDGWAAKRRHNRAPPQRQNRQTDIWRHSGSEYADWLTGPIDHDITNGIVNAPLCAYV